MWKLIVALIFVAVNSQGFACDDHPKQGTQAQNFFNASSGSSNFFSNIDVSKPGETNDVAADTNPGERNRRQQLIQGIYQNQSND